jgi:hypothetical protein
MPNTYYPNKDSDFIAWLANFLILKARKGSETSGASNIAVVNVGGVVPPVM